MVNSIMEITFRLSSILRERINRKFCLALTAVTYHNTCSCEPGEFHIALSRQPATTTTSDFPWWSFRPSMGSLASPKTSIKTTTMRHEQRPPSMPCWTFGIMETMNSPSQYSTKSTNKLVPKPVLSNRPLIPWLWKACPWSSVFLRLAALVPGSISIMGCRILWISTLQVATLRGIPIARGKQADH